MSSADNKRIAKNTLMLYLRMLLTMAVSLYTVRVVLNTLGVVDYGLYNVVGGIVTMFAFLSGTMASASQRFFAFELGTNNIIKLKRIFSTNLLIYFILAAIILILAETIGLWFLNEKMTIPEERMEAARWVYQFSILSFIVTILNIPYNSIIIARENMQIFAYVSILDALLKLGIVYLLAIFMVDKLKLYAILTFVVTLFVTSVYRYICKYKYEESRFVFIFDKTLFKTILSYSGWNLLGAAAGVANNQGINILLNIFFGPIINASRAIAYQVNSAITVFTSNFYTAVNPQIIKSYAINNKNRMFSLVFASSKFAFFMMLFLSLPIFIEMKFMLSLWLSQVNDHMILFTRLIIIFSLINVWESPLTQVSRATGKIMTYQITVGSFALITLPVSYFLFKQGYPNYSAFIVSIVIYFLATFIRLQVIRNLVQFPVKEYINRVMLTNIYISVLAAIFPTVIYYYFPYGVIRFLLTSFVSIFSVFCAVFFFGLNKNEKHMIIEYVIKFGKNTFNLIKRKPICRKH